MSLESDLISEDLQLSPATISEKYTDEEQPVILPIPEERPPCHCFPVDGQEYVRLSETGSSVEHNPTGTPEHHQYEYCQQHSHDCSQYHSQDCSQHHRHECSQHHHQHHHHRSQYQYHHIPHWSTITMSDDDIEILTDPEYYRQFDDVFYIDPSVARSLLGDFLIQEPIPSNLHIQVDTRTKRQRFIARAVMIISVVMFTVSVLLVIISLIMSEHIDNLVRSANTLLKKVSTAPITVSTTEVTIIVVNGTMNRSIDFG